MVRSCLLATLALCVAPPTRFAQDEQPNIVLVFMDNFGWGELARTAAASSGALRHPESMRSRMRA